MQLCNDPRYNGMTLTILMAANIGRRPVTITGMGARRLFPGKAFVATDISPPLPFELTEGKLVCALIDEAGLDAGTLEAFEAWDAAGRTFRRCVAPLSSGFCRA